ncbi:hypothetical protein DMH08_27760 [Actinomadura sp. WAC 06369]|nr:hypothetical protein DMH08_27760 [Actinomadura sp. WAC 06369]
MITQGVTIVRIGLSSRSDLSRSMSPISARSTWTARQVRAKTSPASRCFREPYQQEFAGQGYRDTLCPEHG